MAIYPLGSFIHLLYNWALDGGGGGTKEGSVYCPRTSVLRIEPARFPQQVLNPLTPKISLVILLTVCHAVLVMLVWRI